MSAINDGGPAFPSQTDTFRTPEGRAVGRPAESGMTLRDYFAAHAPEQTGDDDDPEWVSQRAAVPLPKNMTDQDALRLFWARCESELRYAYADAMLKARERQS